MIRCVDFRIGFPGLSCRLQPSLLVITTTLFLRLYCGWLFNQRALQPVGIRNPGGVAEAIRLCERLRGGDYTARQRAQRAWEAGHWARFTLQGRVEKPRPSTHCDVANTVYIVLRAPGYSCPTYRSILGDFTNPGTLSHGFASQAEAKAYCLAAGIEFPAASR